MPEPLGVFPIFSVALIHTWEGVRIAVDCQGAGPYQKELMGMPGRRWLLFLCIYPGLPQIGAGREIFGLAHAIGFTVLLNAALVTTFIFTDAVSPVTVVLEWYAVGAAWLWAAFTAGWWIWKHHPEKHRTEIEQLFREAIAHSLKGQWSDALSRIGRLLDYDGGDCDALMQLGTLYLHTGRPAEAKQAFRRCLELEPGRKWQWEIDQALKQVGQD